VKTMVCCKECLELLHGYLEGGLDAKTYEELSEHFDDCPPCIAFLQTYKTTTKLCKGTLKATDIPEEVQIKLQGFLNENIGRK